MTLPNVEAPGESSVQNDQLQEVCIMIYKCDWLSERTYFVENSSFHCHIIANVVLGVESAYHIICDFLR